MTQQTKLSCHIKYQRKLLYPTNFLAEIIISTKLFHEKNTKTTSTINQEFKHIRTDISTANATLPH